MRWRTTRPTSFPPWFCRVRLHWPLTTVQEKVDKVSAKVIHPARHMVFQMAEVAVPRELFRCIPDPDRGPSIKAGGTMLSLQAEAVIVELIGRGAPYRSARLTESTGTNPHKRELARSKDPPFGDR